MKVETVKSTMDHNLSSRAAQRSNRAMGFTLVELLVVIAIISVLISILLPSLSRVRQSAERVAVASNLRQLNLAYISYAQQNRGTLLPGYLPTGAPAVHDRVRNGSITGVPARRWTSRLASSFPELWKITRPQRDPVEMLSSYEAASLYPIFGLNTVYLGGHDSTLFLGYVAGRPNVGKHVVFRLSEVKRPSNQITFVETVIRNGSQTIRADEGLLGFHYVTPPRGLTSTGIFWTNVGEQIAYIGPSTPAAGVPYSRVTPNQTNAAIPVAHLDGHVTTLRPRELVDMRRWSPRATTPDWSFEP